MDDGSVGKTEIEWASQAKRLVRTEMVRRGITYDELAERLAKLGLRDTPANMRNKISRGTFTAVFLLQVMEAIGCRSLDLQVDRSSETSRG